MVQQMTGCSREEAEKALFSHETVLDAVDSLIPSNPVTSGSKYIPKKPVVSNGLDEEQAKLCERGRWLQDRVNAVFSVAHSKVRTQPETLQEVPSEQKTTISVVEAPPSEQSS